MRKRVDILLVEKGIMSSREKAQVAVLAGNVLIDGKEVLKPSQTVDVNSKIELKEKSPYVSRGGEKLEKAIKDFKIDIKDKIALDIGASCGGFTSCLLVHGAKKVYAVDVGYGQLHSSLREDTRVINLEKTNARYLTEEMFKDKIDIITIDVSFISVKKILPKVKNLIGEDGKIILLIKPQFEAERKYVKKGVIRDKNIHFIVLSDICNFCKSCDLFVENITYSPLKGPAGNIEYFFLLGKNKVYIEESEIKNIIEEAHLMCR